MCWQNQCHGTCLSSDWWHGNCIFQAACSQKEYHNGNWVALERREDLALFGLSHENDSDGSDEGDDNSS